MGYRRNARELAMQALFFMDMRRAFSEEGLSLFCAAHAPGKNARAFFTQLVRGVMETRGELDRILEIFSNNWKISRMSCVDRNVMRIALYELLCCPDIPVKVSINEAIDIGKYFGTDESGAFINGILDSARKALDASDERVKISEKMPVPEKMDHSQYRSPSTTVQTPKTGSGLPNSVPVTATIRRRRGGPPPNHSQPLKSPATEKGQAS